MDPVQSFLTTNRSFSFSALLNIQSRLTSHLILSGELLYEDVVRITTESAQVDAADVNAYVGLLVESSLEPKITAKGHMTLHPKEDLVENKHAFAKCLLYVMYAKLNNEELESVSKFKAEVISHLRNVGNPQSQSQSQPPAIQPPLNNFSMEGRSQSNPSPIVQLTPSSSMHPKLSTDRDLPTVVDNDFAMINPGTRRGHESRLDHAPSHFEDIETVEPVVRLLAQLRRFSMDILFPLTLQDKVSATVPFHSCVLLV